MVTTDITTGSFSWGTMSYRSELAMQRVGSNGWSGLLASKDITTRAYRLRLEAELSPPKNPLKMVFSSPWTGVSCAWSLMVTSPFGSSWSASRYSFKNPSFTKLASWWPRVIHRSTLCPNTLWNSHQASLRDPRFWFVLWEISACPLPLTCLAIPCMTLETGVELPNPP